MVMVHRRFSTFSGEAVAVMIPDQCRRQQCRTRRVKGPGTRVIDLGGRMLLPGLHDVHMHVFGIVEPDTCSLRSEAMTLEQMVPYLQECVQRYKYPPGAWIAVDMWDFSTGNQVSKRLPSCARRWMRYPWKTDHPVGQRRAPRSRKQPCAGTGQGPTGQCDWHERTNHGQAVCRNPRPRWTGRKW
jgi:hypothetical protein